MKITKKIAAATLVPAAVAGITVSSLAVASAADTPRAQQAGQADTRHPADEAAHTARGQASTVIATSLHRAQAVKAKAHHVAQAKAHRHAVPTPAQAAPSSTSIFAGMSAFERCVAWRESGNNPTASSAGMFGILPSTWASLGYPGTAGTSSVALQKQAFDRLYAQYGTSPWAPYDGC
jgi:hypothetical protein